MSEPRNIEIFQGLVARYLSRLYGEFPIPRKLDTSWAGHEIAELLGSGDEEAMCILSEYCPSSMEFLVREGFVDYQPKRRVLSDASSVFPEAVLTLKGFSLLGAVPESVDISIERRPVAQQLSEALADGARDTVGDIVKRLFFGALLAGSSALSA